MTREELKTITNEELIEELDYCGYDSYYSEYRADIVAEIKKRMKEPILGKIRDEIESCREDEEPHLCDYRYHRNEGLDMALDIIDKYKSKSEDKE